MSDQTEGQTEEEQGEEEEVVTEVLFSEGESMDMMRAPDDDGAQSAPLWLITFTDVMALMLTFFVLLYSMAAPDEEVWKGMTAALNSELGKFYSDEWNSGDEDTVDIAKIDNTRALNLDYLESVVKELIGNESELSDVVIIPQRDHLIISLPDDVLFDAGQAEIKDRGRTALFTLAGTLSRIKNRIEVIGHADPRPIQSERFPSNWDLSLARALEVAGFLDNVGYNRPIVVRGLSSARYDELPDIEEERRLNYARRVDVVVMKDDGQTRGGTLNFGL